ncbi:MAG: bifunctional nuclease family protein [Chloroflexi bacterium]|nr:bifunctional nuclease family protein [Chloroflexota bacterium]
MRRANNRCLTCTNLVQRAQAGEVSAFARLVERHQAALLSFCRRLTGNNSGAQDLAQEALLRAFQGLARLEEPSRFPAWLFGIAANLARRWWQRRARWPLSLESLAEAYPDVPWQAIGRPAATPERALEEAEYAARLQAAIESLPVGLGHVLALHYIDGLSYAEIAAALDVPVSTIKGRLFKSRTRLHRSLVAAGMMPPAPSRQSLTDTSRLKGGPNAMSNTNGEPPAGLVPVRVDRIGMKTEAPTTDNVLHWLKQLPTQADAGTGRPDLEALAQQLTPVLAQAGVLLRTPHRWVILREIGGVCALPIVIGVPEADAIALHLQGHQAPRPCRSCTPPRLISSGYPHTIR